MSTFIAEKCIPENEACDPNSNGKFGQPSCCTTLHCCADGTIDNNPICQKYHHWHDCKSFGETCDPSATGGRDITCCKKDGLFCNVDKCDYTDSV